MRVHRRRHRSGRAVGVAWQASDGGGGERVGVVWLGFATHLSWLLEFQLFCIMVNVVGINHVSYHLPIFPASPFSSPLWK
jgi:hypothetical protein